jgi:predicted SAM-dependent methyltransferase
VRRYVYALRRRLEPARRRRRLVRAARRSPCRIVIGSSGIAQPGWEPTEADDLDLLRPDDWRRFFDEGSIDAMLAEHVWEHLTPEQGVTAATTCFRYLKAGGYARVAVPDGLHPDPEYIEWVRPGGVGAGADDHRVLYDHRTLRDVFERAGFDVRLLEYWDDEGRFHAVDWDPEAGLIRRSRRFDERNADGEIRYTSLILDARKP